MNGYDDFLSYLSNIKTKFMKAGELFDRQSTKKD